MLFVIALLAAQAQESAKGPQPLKPLTSPGSWVTDDDYPPSAVRQGHDGTVAFQLRIDSSGLPAGCSVTQSSGHEELDQQVCSLLVQRARFSPARNAAGKAIAAPYNGRFNWRLARGETFLQPSTSSMEFELSANDILLNCRLGDKRLETAGQTCGPMVIGAPAQGFAAVGGGKHRRITTELFFEIGSHKPMLYDAPGQVKISKRTALFEADAEGRRVKCEALMETPGIAAPLPAVAEMCTAVPTTFAGEHRGPGGSDGPLSGSVVVATSWKELP